MVVHDSFVYDILKKLSYLKKAQQSLLLNVAYTLIGKRRLRMTNARLNSMQHSALAREINYLDVSSNSYFLNRQFHIVDQF